MSSQLEWPDYLSILSMLMLSWSVGIYYACKGRLKQNKVQDGGENEGELMTRYALGNYKMGVLPVAFSISATTLSGNSIVGAVGEVYLYGGQYIFFTVGSTIGLVISAFLVIPVYRQLKYISIYEYLERRYNRAVRLCFSAIYIIAKMVFSSVALYVPALCISTLTDVPQWISVAFSGTICICYCVSGGIKGVIWTDVIQSFFMVTCNLLLIIFGVIRVGGVQKVIDACVQSGRIGHITYIETANTRYSIWSLLIGSAVIFLNAMCAGQATVQRVLSVRSLREAQKATLTGAVLVCCFLSMTVMTALVIYANFWTCDPFLRPEETKIRTSDQILMYGVAAILDKPGLKGLALAGIFSGSLSTFSSYINSFATLTVEDFVKPVLKDQHRSLSDKNNVLLCKFFTCVFGIMSILMAFAVPFLGGIIQAGMQITGATGGPLLGVIFLGIFCRKANARGVLIALISGLIFCFWLSVGSLMHKRPYTTLPLYDYDCAVKNVTSEYKTSSLYENSTIDSMVEFANDLSLESYVFPIYRLSFFWQGPIGFLITFTLGLVTSILLGSTEDKKRKIDPRLLSTLVNNSGNSELDRKMADVNLLSNANETVTL